MSIPRGVIGSLAFAVLIFTPLARVRAQAPNDTCSTAFVLPLGSVVGSLAGAVDDYRVSCAPRGLGDVVHEFLAAPGDDVLITVETLSGNGSSVTIRPKEQCTGTAAELTCASPSAMTQRLYMPTLNLSGSLQAYSVIVKGDSSNTYALTYQKRPPVPMFAYWRIDSTDQFVPLVGATTDVEIPLGDTPAGAGDEWSRSIALPFAFSFYGTSYSSVNVSSDLYLTFAPPPSGAASQTNDCSLDATTPTTLIAPFWDDGNSSASYPSKLLYKIEGTAPARQITIEFRDWDLLSCVATNCSLSETRLNHQVVLFESGDIEFRYGPRQAAEGDSQRHSGLSATIGLRSGPVTDTVQCNTASPAVVDGRVMRFVHPARRPTISTATPTITATGALNRTQGSAGVVASIATVSDGQDAPGSLTVTATAVPTGITIAGINNTNGTVTANVAAACSAAPGENSVTLQAENSGGVTSTATVTVNVDANTGPALGTYPASNATEGGSATVTPQVAPTDNGGLTGITASAPGFTGTFSVDTLSGVLSIVSAGPAGTHTVTVTATDTCGASTSTTLTLTVTAVTPAAPTGVIATATTSTSVNISWIISSGVIGYEVLRRSAGVAFTLVGSPADPPFVDTNATPDTAFLYVVRSVHGSANRSENSAPDLATTVMFSDDPIALESTTVRGVHVDELRVAINAVRALAPIPSITFTDAPLAGVAVKMIHVEELRSAVDAARDALILPSLTYADSPITAGNTTIKAVHLTELRNAVK